MTGLWAMEWHSRNLLDGDQRVLMVWSETSALIFRTRQECRAHIEQRYGYIRQRADLRAEPHGWRMPQAVRVALKKLGEATE